MKKINFSKELLAISSIILLGAFLRFYKLKNYIVFLGDEGRDALVVYNILHGHLTLLGPTSSVGGFFLGPIYYYMMAPFLWLSNYDPVGPAIMVVVVGLITIYLVYLLGKDFFGLKAGLVSALLYAISPVVTIYSRSSWNPNVFPFFSIASLYALYKGVEKNKWWLFVLAGIFMGINLQIHYLATFVGVIIFFYILFVDFRPKFEWVIETARRYLFIFIGFLIGFSPFLTFEARHQFANTQNIIRFIFNSQETGVSGNLTLNAYRAFERLFPGLLISFPSFQNYSKFDQTLLGIWHLAGVILGIFLIAFFLYFFIRDRKKKDVFRKYFLIFVWLLFGLGLFLLYKKSIYDYYLGFIFPVPFLLAGFALSFLVDRYKKIGMAFVAGALVVLVAINLKFAPIATPGNQQVNQMKTISDFILSKSNGAPFNFGLSGSGNSDHAYRYFFRLAGRDPVTIAGINVDPERKSVTDQLFVVCERPPCSPLGESSNEIAGFGRAEVADEWMVTVAKVYKLVHYRGNE